TATTSSPPGSYPITVGVGTLAAANYDFPTLVNGTLTITAATQIAPDLAVFASDITFSPAHPDPGQPVTLSAVIRNLGPADASNITVAALDFTNSVGSLTIPSLGAGASTQVSFNLTGFPESYRLITIEVDPDHQIQELNENNNEASVVLQVGNPQFSVSGATIVVQTNSASACASSVVPIQGHANYDFLALPGTSYPVQGGRVTITIEDPATSQVIATYTGTHTLVDGSFSQPILAPAEAGTYTVITEVTDSTVTDTAISNLVVTVCPNAPPPLPAVPPSDGTSGGGSPWIGTVIGSNSNTPAPGDVYVFSEDIVFSNQPERAAGSIFIAACIKDDGTVPVYYIPVDVNDIFPVNGALHSFPIGETTVDFPSPSTQNYAVVVMPWTNTAGGAHIIQVAVDPPFPQFTGNDKATRLIGVGAPTNFLKLDTQVTDVDHTSAFSPGDTLQYTITYTNTGTSDLTGATLESDFDQRFLLTPFNISSGGTVADGTVSWNLGTIAAGATGSVTYQAELEPPAQFPAGTAPVTSISILDTDQTDPIANSVSINVTGDVVPPTTTATVTPAPNAAGWNNTDVGVTLSAVDNPGGSGVDRILYAVDGGPASSVAGNTASLNFVDEGIHTIEFQAVDAVGNVEPAQTIQVKFDKTPPTSYVNPLAPQQTSSTFPVTVTGSDPSPAPGVTTSGVTSFDLYVSTDGTTYSLDATLPSGSPDAGGVYTATTTFTGQNDTTYYFYAVAHDAAGNTQSIPTSAQAQTHVLIPASPAINTSQQPASATVGTSIADQATVSGGDSPTGTVTFTLYSNPNETGTPLFTDANVPLSGGMATYNGNANNNSVTSGTASEPVVIIPASPAINTSQQPASATVGTSIADQATVSGGDSPTGTVTFTLYSNPNGTGTPLFTDANVPLSGGMATSTGYTATATGTDYWVATYNGDSNNNPVTSGTASEPVIISPATPAINTSQQPASATVGSSIADKATVSGGDNPTG